MSRKIVLFIATSLDGFIATKDHDIDWLFTDQDYGYTEFYSGIETVVMGRRTYDKILTFGDFPYKEKDCYVITSKPRKDSSDVTFISKEVVSKVVEMKNKRVAGDIWLVGGAYLLDYFLKYNLVDEIVLSVHPILLGDGIPLFLQRGNRILLDLQDSKTYSTDLVQLRYKIKK